MSTLRGKRETIEPVDACFGGGFHVVLVELVELPEPSCEVDSLVLGGDGI